MKRIFWVLFLAVLLHVSVFADDATLLSSDTLLKELNIPESLCTDAFMREVEEFIRTARPSLYRSDERIEAFADKDYKSFDLLVEKWRGHSINDMLKYEYAMQLALRLAVRGFFEPIPYLLKTAENYLGDSPELTATHFAACCHLYRTMCEFEGWGASSAEKLTELYGRAMKLRERSKEPSINQGIRNVLYSHLKVLGHLQPSHPKYADIYRQAVELYQYCAETLSSHWREVLACAEPVDCQLQITGRDGKPFAGRVVIVDCTPEKFLSAFVPERGEIVVKDFSAGSAEIRLLKGRTYAIAARSSHDEGGNFLFAEVTSPADKTIRLNGQEAAPEYRITVQANPDTDRLGWHVPTTNKTVRIRTSSEEKAFPAEEVAATFANERIFPASYELSPIDAAGAAGKPTSVTVCPDVSQYVFWRNWKEKFFREGDFRPSADTDGDGRTDMDEFLCQTDPRRRDEPEVMDEPGLFGTVFTYPMATGTLPVKTGEMTALLRAGNTPGRYALAFSGRGRLQIEQSGYYLFRVVGGNDAQLLFDEQEPRLLASDHHLSCMWLEKGEHSVRLRFRQERLGSGTWQWLVPGTAVWEDVPISVLHSTPMERKLMANRRDMDFDGFPDEPNAEWVVRSLSDFRPVLEIKGCDFAQASQGVFRSGGGAECARVSAVLSYRFELPQKAENMLLKVSGCKAFSNAIDATSWVGISVDGCPEEMQVLDLYQQNSADLYFRLPELEQGAHKLTVTVNSLHASSIPKLNALVIGSVADTRDIRSDIFNVPAASWVSPVCVEGRSETPCTGFVINDSLKPSALPRDSWYADVPLLAGKRTPVSIKNESSGQMTQYNVRWLPLDFGEWNRKELILRVNDSILLQNPDQIKLDGKSLRSDQAEGRLLPLRFEKSGRYRLEDAAERTVFITVIDGAFPASAILATTSSPRTVRLPFAAKVRIESEDFVHVAQNPLENGGCEAAFTCRKPGTTLIAARLPGGSVLAVGRLCTLAFTSAAQRTGRYHELMRFPDGTRLAENRLYVMGGELPDDFSIVVKGLVSGTTFDDGTTVLRKRAGDFKDGSCRIHFLISRYSKFSLCHTYQLFQGDDPISMGSE